MKRTKEQIIEASRGEGVIKLNRILNTYTGENISDSKLGIKGGKLAGEQIKVNIPKSSPTKIKGTYAGLDKDGNPIFK